MLQAACVVLLIAAVTALSVPGTGALFTGDYPDVVTISTGQIFPAEHVSPAFAVSDHSSGSGTDVSSPVAFAADGLSATTSAWPAAFASDHYVDLRLNEILPANVALSAASFDLSWASAAGTACLYFEVRTAGGTLIDAEGNPGSPLSCTSSATPVDPRDAPARPRAERRRRRGPRPDFRDEHVGRSHRPRPDGAQGDLRR